MKAAPDATRIGETVGGKYRIVRLLARGGMGVVYEAHHAVVRRRFAIKFLRRDLAERRDILNRFQREAEAAGALENDNVTAAVDFGISDDGAPFIVMEYLVGESLADLLEREGRLPVQRAADLVAQACRGVDAAHAAGIVHRDLKPHNLFVARRDDGTDLVKVLDFGVAKLQAIDEATAATGTGTILGTAAYMSPEQARGEKAVDKRTDIYALGAILFEILSKKMPHPGDSPNAILHHIATQAAVPLDSVQPDLPAPLVAIVARILSSDPAARPAAAGALAQELAPFARREVWPPPPETSAPNVSGLASTSIAAPEAQTPVALRAESKDSTFNDRHGSAPPAPRRLPGGARAALSSAVVAAAAIAVFVGLRPKSITPPLHVRPAHPLAEGTKFFVPALQPATSEQITRLGAAGALRDASLLTVMASTPHSVGPDDGVQDVEPAIRKIVLRALSAGEVPILYVYNLPFRDCARYGAGGARDGAAYRAWIDGYVRGVGNERAMVMLEPTGLGIIPYNTSLDGSVDWCKPTVADADGKAGPAPGATAEEQYALLGWAVERFAKGAPNALVYLDGTHGGWLTVGEAAYRLSKARVDLAQGFAVNFGNTRTTAESLKYATWISKCLLYAAHGGGTPARFKECPGPGPDRLNAPRDWVSPDKWYAENVDRAPWAAGIEPAHFVVDTSRNGRGPPDVTLYERPPFNQPREVVEKLYAGRWCNAPSAGLGVRPTVNTGAPLADAFLWIKVPGQSDGSCDIAGGARAWDFSKFNPWAISGASQRHFDPLWGMVNPAAGEWFPDAAVQVARNADPPLVEGEPPTAVEKSAAGAPAVASTAPGDRGRPPGRPGGRSARRPERAPAAASAAAAEIAPASAPKIPTSLPPTFDPANPYR
jgi:endoglucanase